MSETGMKPLWIRRLRAIGISAFKYWNSLHSNALNVLKVDQQQPEIQNKTRDAKSREEKGKDFDITLSGRSQADIPDAASQTFVHTAADICNDPVLSLTRESLSDLSLFLAAIGNADLCRLGWSNYHTDKNLL